MTGNLAHCIGYAGRQPKEDQTAAASRHKRQRPAALRGYTMKMMSPLGDLYVTINEDDYALRASRAKAGSDAGKGMV